MNLLIMVVVNALGLGAAAWLVDGITVAEGSTTDRAITLLVVGLIFGLINAFLGTFLKILSLPFIVLTLGVLLVVINALMLLLTDRLAESMGLGFNVDGFWAAFWGALIISIVGGILNAVLDD